MPTITYRANRGTWRVHWASQGPAKRYSDNFLPDVCTECFPDCHCFSCTELRQQMAEDWHEQMSFEASRGN